jgi:hypothetical protein
MFLSKALTLTEQKYGSTELEVAGLCWVIKKIRHLIESSTAGPLIVFTDHSATPTIAKQTKSDTRANTKLRRASDYLSQFKLDIRHKPGKSHIVPDALSRLEGQPPRKAVNEDGEILDVFAFHVSLAELTEETKTRLQNDYRKDPHWSKILAMLEIEAARDLHTGMQNAPNGLSFALRDGLIYHVVDDRVRLCLPSTFEKEIFRLAHDQNAHSGFVRTYQRVAESLYFKGLSRRLRLYIEHCHQCQLSQTKRHRPYGSLVPITPPQVPYHTVAMDFIVELPLTPDGLDTLATLTDKFSKRVMLVSGKGTDSAEIWAKRVLDRLQMEGWGIPRAFISDRDSKFMSAFWRTIFEKLETKMLTASAYHPQADGQSERTNQTVEIAIRFITINHENVSWVDALPSLQFLLFTSPNQATGHSPSHLLYGFQVRDATALLNDEPPLPDLDLNRLVWRQEATDALAYANAKAKIYYDSRHKPLMLSPGSFAFLRLHKGYKIPGVHKKLGQQRIGPFKILKRVGRLAYKLELPPRYKIHPVVSVDHLEPAPLGSDPFDRTRPDHPPAVYVEGDDEEWTSYEIEKLVDKRTRRYGRGKPITEYKVRWKGYGIEFDEWYGEDLLQNAQEMIREYEEKNIMSHTTRAIQQNDITDKTEPIPHTDMKRRRGRPKKNVD